MEPKIEIYPQRLIETGLNKSIQLSNLVTLWACDRVTRKAELKLHRNAEKQEGDFFYRCSTASLAEETMAFAGGKSSNFCSIKALVKNGLIERHPDHGTIKAKYLRITDLGYYILNTERL